MRLYTSCISVNKSFSGFSLADVGRLDNGQVTFTVKVALAALLS